MVKTLKKLLKENTYGLNVIDNYIYCIEKDEKKGQNNLIKMKTNGKKKEVLAQDVDASQIVAIEKWVYYFKNSNLYRVRTNGTDREKFSDRKISYYQIVDSKIYYIYSIEGSQYIATMKLNGKKATRISKIDTGMQCQALYVKGTSVYYLITGTEDNIDKEMYLYKMNKKGEKISKVCKIDSNVKEVNMQEDEIYYTTMNDYENFTIKAIKYNGTDKKVIKKIKACDNLNITKKWVVVNTINEDYDTIVQIISKDGKKEKNI